MRKITKINDDLKSILLKQSMVFVNSSAYDYTKSVYEGDYFYLVNFSNSLDFTLLSKENNWSMIVTVFDKKSNRYIDYKDSCVEILDGYYMFRQEKQDTEFSYNKMNYWLGKLKCDRRNKKLNLILNKSDF